MKEKSGAARQPENGLSPARILAAAVAVADAEGLPSTTMRRLARDFSVTPMALYWHFTDKDDLLNAMAEKCVAEAEFVSDPDLAWPDRLRHVLTGLVELLRVHPWMGRLLIERVVPLPNYLNALEIMLDSCREAGFGPNDQTVLVQQSIQSVVALVEYAPHQPAGARHGDRSERDAIRTHLQDLPAERFPNTRAAADSLVTPPDVDDYFGTGVDLLVRGIEGIASSRGGDSRNRPVARRARR